MGKKEITKNKNSKKTIEDKYRKLKDQHEHILKRPGMYIGSIKKETSPIWIFNEKKEETDPHLVLKEIMYVPGLYKIYDEILVNARDHAVRCAEEGTELCTNIKVNIDEKTGRITVWNNGEGIPVEEHKDHHILIPAMIFGELLTGSNYNDEEQRTVGGTNGLGAKLTNIYSTEFEVETLDAERDKKFYQKFGNNMYEKGIAKVTSGHGKKSYTKISFIPDFKRFGIDGLTSDIISLFKKRVYDIAMTSSAKVYYNNELISANNFTKYVDLYFPENSKHSKYIDVSNEKWKVCVVYDPAGEIEHQTISFVNGICTIRGGTHVDYIVNQIINRIKLAIKKKAKDLNVKPAQIKENLIFFIDSIIVNPEFDTQTKELLKTKVADFGSTYTAPESFLKKIIRCGVVDQIIATAEAKEKANLQYIGKTKGAVRLAKLYDAHRAKLRKGDCTLMVTEGDSAKGFAMGGTNVIGRDLYGVFPLKGKLLNVRKEKPGRIKDNEEIASLIQIIGLEIGKEYHSTEGLRYGSIMILADQDVDGIHIRGLVMNFIQYFWPSLAKLEGFVKSFNTPILKAFKGKKEIQFTSVQEFDEWKKDNNEGKGWKIKYYKGLGTSDPTEVQECFKDMDKKVVQYYWLDKVDRKENKKTNLKNKDKNKSNSDNKTASQSQDELSEDLENNTDDSDIENTIDDTEIGNDDDTDIANTIEDTKNGNTMDATESAFELAFSKKKNEAAKSRRLWMEAYDPSLQNIGYTPRKSYYHFVHDELIEYALYSTTRTTPNIMDGFKPGQRKVYCGSIKENIYEKEIKVGQLTGSISKTMHYHHGEDSLNKTIINMAQDFVGSNNINLLVPKGLFGTRLCGGDDCASPRYIHVLLDKLGKKIFIEDDFAVLNHQYEDGDLIEPRFYAPIIPMILVNGVKSIGTGYSSTIEPCNPREIYDNLKRIIQQKKPKTMHPWYRHFTGTIEKIDNHRYISRAKYEIVGNNTVVITDLPIGVWTDDYKLFLNNLIDPANKKKSNKTETNNKSDKSKVTTKGNKNGKKGKKGGKKRVIKSNTSKVAKINHIGADIKSIQEDCTDIKINFTITFHPDKLQPYIENGTLQKYLKLVSPLSLSNMHLFDENGKIKKFDSYTSILEHFAKVRLELYQKRKDYLLGLWKKERDMLKWKLKFMEDVISEKIIIFKKTTKEITEQLEQFEFPKFLNNSSNKETYDYLTTIAIGKFTEDEVEKLRNLIKNKVEDIATLKGKSPGEIWEAELDEFIAAYDKWEAEQDKKYYDRMNSNKKKTKKSLSK